MIINPYLVVPPYDPDAQAFITATGLTTPTQQNAINELVLDLKGANIWTKFNALYPMITDKVTQVDIANQMKFNLKNPLDTNGAFRLTWSGGWAWSANGATPNGSSAYANTNFTASSNLTLYNSHLSYYSRTSGNPASTQSFMGNNSNTGTFDNKAVWNIAYQNTGAALATQHSVASVSDYASATQTSRAAFWMNNRTSSTSTTLKIWKNGTSVANATTTPGGEVLNTSSAYLGARRNTVLGGSQAELYTNAECSFASIGSGLTDTEAQLFYQIVEKYQVALSRNINPTQSFYYNRNYGNEANAYLFATQITNTSTQVAIGTFIGELKSYNIWTKMKAIYPMITDKTLQVDMANQMKYNLVNPQDTNDSFRITWAGGLTYSSNGVISNGSSGYGNTNFTPSVHAPSSLNNVHISAYSRTNINENNWEIGASRLTAVSQYLGMYSRTVTNLFYPLANVNNNNLGTANVANSDSRGLFIANRTASNSLKGFRNNVKVLDNSTPSDTIINIPLFISALNNSGAPTGYSNKQIAFASIGDGLTDAEASNFYTAVQNLQTTLGRAILPTPPIVSDPDAQAFINSANIVDQVEATAANNLVIGLKADGLWTPMKAIYPMVGSSASSCAVNLKTVGTYNLSFVGGWTFSQNGALPTGTGYANTNLNSSTVLTLNSTHLSYYSRTTSAVPSAFEIGNLITSNSFGLSCGLGNVAYSDQYNYNTARISQANTDARGFYIGTRTSSAIHKLFKNGNQFGTTNTGASGTFNNLVIYIGALNNNGTATTNSVKECAFASIGDGLTDAQAANLYTRVQAFNTALNRQV